MVNNLICDIVNNSSEIAELKKEFENTSVECSAAYKNEWSLRKALEEAVKKREDLREAEIKAECALIYKKYGIKNGSIIKTICINPYSEDARFVFRDGYLFLLNKNNTISKRAFPEGISLKQLEKEDDVYEVVGEMEV